jgi:hypothetical protein
MDPHGTPGHPLPVACYMTGATDTPAERIDEFRRLFRRSLVGRSRTRDSIRFRLRADPGVEGWVRDLARREKACCAFFDFTVDADGQEVRWEARVGDDEAARQMLAGLYRLADTAGVTTASG